VETNFPERSWFSANTFPEKRDLLSGGKWLSNSGKRDGPEAFARWRVRVPAAGTYGLWARKFWKHGPFRWRFDEGEWRTCGRDPGLLDAVPLRTHVVANWVRLGEAELKEGTRSFEIRLLAGPGEALTAAFDCFLLSKRPFSPRGRWKPGEPSGAEEEGWWPLEPGPDAFGDALLDLRGMNEEVAGRSGPVRRAGAGLVTGDGKPVRFWAVNVGPGVVRSGRPSVLAVAKRLARSGVNLVRIHGPVRDRDYLDRLHFFVHSLKEEGIYTHLSFFFPLWIDPHPFARLFFDPEVQERWRGSAKLLLSTENPYTGLPLAKDPAVAFVEIVNEDSLLFWTFKPGETIPWDRMEILEREFGVHLAKRHGSIAAARRRWGGAHHPRDAPEAGRVGLLPIWNLTAKGHGEGGRRRRAADQLRFLVERQRAFYGEAVRYLREDLGVVSLISCGNWKTADPRLLDPLERWTYEAGDVLDRHGYFGGRHEGEGAGWSVRVGHRFADRPGVRHPAALPIACVQTADRPQLLSEIGWTAPNRRRADGPLVCAAYGALQGIDGVCLFAVQGAGWSAASPKFPVNVPTVLGQFPACALLYRRGDVGTPDPVVHETLDLGDLLDFGGSAAVAPPALDTLRGRDVPPGGRIAGAPAAIDPLAFFVGPVERRVAQSAKGSRHRDLRPFVDREERTVSSANGDLAWDWGRGLLIVRTERCQGAAGFLEAAGGTLNPTEVAHLAFSGKLIAYELGMRFLTDHLDGDLYFRVHREGQNLDRARTQLKLPGSGATMYQPPGSCRCTVTRVPRSGRAVG